MKVRFQADADLNQILLKATLRREPSIDFQTAYAAGLVSLNDKEILAKAAEQGRVLVTHDRKTMPKTLCGIHRNTGEPGRDYCSAKTLGECGS